MLSQDCPTPGSQNKERAEQLNHCTLEVYVTTVSIKLSVQNGVSETKSSVFGEDLLPMIDKLLEERMA